jgi:NitT/TauT family transport system substrate-binding protein
MLRAQGLTDLVIFDPAEFGVVFPRDTMIASEETVNGRPDIVRRFLRASLRGWKEAATHQAEAVDAVLRRNPTLDRAHQGVMMREVAKLLSWGAGTTAGVGYIDAEAVAAAHDFLFRNKQITNANSPDGASAMQFWKDVPPAYKRLG